MTVPDIHRKAAKNWQMEKELYRPIGVKEVA